MGPLKWLAARTPWFDKSAVTAYVAGQAKIWSSHLASATVLEVGCGPGSFGQEVVQKYGARDYVGTDLSRGMVKGARQSLAGHAFAVAGAAALPFRSRAFDIVVACFLLHHVPVPDRQSCVAEFLRVAGRFVIIQDVYGFAGGMARIPYELYSRLADGSYYRFTLEEWTALFASQGARIVERVDSGPHTIVRRIGCWVLEAR